MASSRDLIRHEILNIFTIINYYISEDSFGEQEKQQVLQLLRVATLLVGHQEIFLDEKPRFFAQDVSLNELLETFVMLHEQEIRRRMIDISLPTQQVKLSMDRYYVSEAVAQVFERLVESASVIECSYDEQKNTLVVSHDGDLQLEEEKKPLISYLNVEKRDLSQLAFQLALRLFELLGVQLNSEGHTLKFVFPQQQAQVS